MESSAVKVGVGAPAGLWAARTRMFFGSTVGKKVVMAVTGVILVVFVIGHMIGNLQVYLGPESLNHYAELLRELLHGSFIWIFRATLLAAVVLHVWAATATTLGSWKARPINYKKRQKYVESTYASRTMRWGGPILLIFIIYHLLHLTTGQAHGEFVHGDVYHNVIAGFSVWYVSAFYVFAMLALGFHLWHGIWSMLQTLGLSHPSYNGLRSAIAWFVTLLVVAGNISIPVAILTGLVS
jgi:succinate dehydrogenase / fumarate reductase cytochrome b subunit